MAIQKQEETTLVSEQKAESNNPQWHAPALTVYHAEDAENGTNLAFSDLHAYGS
jgi:hypothetical protein